VGKVCRVRILQGYNSIGMTPTKEQSVGRGPAVFFVNINGKEKDGFLDLR
jgi:hypothetical protein